MEHGEPGLAWSRHGVRLYLRQRTWPRPSTWTKAALFCDLSGVEQGMSTDRSEVFWGVFWANIAATALCALAFAIFSAIQSYRETQQINALVKSITTMAAPSVSRRQCRIFHPIHALPPRRPKQNARVGWLVTSVARAEW